MKKYILIFLCLMMVSGSFAQIKDFKFKFYGQIRTDLYYNSRANEETVDGLFYMYPKDKVRDEDGNDLNGTPSSNFYTLYSRLGVDVAGPKLGTAKTSANRSRLSGYRYFLFGSPPAPCLSQSGLGEIGLIARSNLASTIWRCCSADSESFCRSTFPAIQPCTTNSLPLY